MLQVGQWLQKPCEKSKVERLSCAAIIKSEPRNSRTFLCYPLSVLISFFQWLFGPWTSKAIGFSRQEGYILKMLCITAEKSQRNYFSTWPLFPVSDSLTHSPPALTLFGEMVTGRFNKSIEYLASRYSRALADSTCRVKQRTRKKI